MVLFILRGIFILLAASVAMVYVLTNQSAQGLRFGPVLLVVFTTLAIASGIVATDVLAKRKKLSSLSGVFLGLVVGLVAAYALNFPIELMTQTWVATMDPKDLAAIQSFENMMQGVKVFIGMVTCYGAISLVLQTKDDFRFVIPYVEFSKQIRGTRPILLDTSIIIDGRIVDVVRTRLIQGALIVPKFVLNELQTIADSADKLRRARGRRGLDVLQHLQDVQMIDVSVDDGEAEGSNVDQKLMSLALQMQARVMTNDYNLGKIAKLRGVDVINLNDLATALRPVVLPGESMTVKIIKAGEAPNQGVGYLDDGTMVVVENARHRQSEMITLTVTSTLQTSAGRMIFGRHSIDDEHHADPARAPEPEARPQPAVPAPADEQAHRVGRNPRRTA